MMNTTGARAGRGRRIAAGGIAAAVLLLPAVLLAQVDTAWVRRYDGPAHGSDWANCIAVDSAGNVYVTGTSAFDTGYVNLDWVTIKYRPNGDTAWVKRRDFGGDFDEPNGLAVDACGNLYVTGAANRGMAMVKYDSLGQVVWTSRPGPNDSITANGLALGPDGSVYACGGRRRASWDAMLMRYRPDGDTAWARCYDWAGDNDALDAVAVGWQCDIAATGTCTDGSPGGDYLVLLYDTSGVRGWARAYNGPGGGADWAVAVAVDSDGNCIVTGMSDNGYGTPPDYLTVKYSPDGETLWTRRYNGTANDWDEARGIAVDSAGNVYVTGYATNSGTFSDFVTIKYQSDGTVCWLARYDGPGHGGDGGSAIAVGPGGQVYVTGGSGSSPTGHVDCVTICYDSLGDTVWVRRYNTPQNWEEYTTELALGPGGSVYVAGIAYGSGGNNPDILVIKYAPTGAVAESPAPPVNPPPAISVLPNPCRTHALVRWQPPGGGPARVSIFDALGRPVRMLLDGSVAAGEILWDRTDAAGQRVPAGVYFVVLDAGGVRSMVKVTVLD